MSSIVKLSLWVFALFIYVKPYNLGLIKNLLLKSLQHAHQRILACMWDFFAIFVFLFLLLTNTI